MYTYKIYTVDNYFLLTINLNKHFLGKFELNLILNNIQIHYSLFLYTYSMLNIFLSNKLFTNTYSFFLKFINSTQNNLWKRK